MTDAAKNLPKSPPTTALARRSSLLLLMAVMFALPTAGLVRWFMPPRLGLHIGSYQQFVRVAIEHRGSVGEWTNVKLPSPLRGAAGTHVTTAIIREDHDGQTMVYFPHWRGPGCQVEGYLYVDPDQPPESVGIPCCPDTPEEPVEVRVSEHLRAHWYLAGRRQSESDQGPSSPGSQR